MNYFKNVKSIEELKKQYRELAMKHHPDKGGSEEIMKAINNEYEKLFDQFKKADEMQDDYRKIIDALINFDLTIEIIGTWVWISGNTYTVKTELKGLGFQWASQKKAWYWHPGEYLRTRKKNFSLDEIRTMHNSQTVKTCSDPKYRPRLGA